MNMYQLMKRFAFFIVSGFGSLADRSLISLLLHILQKLRLSIPTMQAEQKCKYQGFQFFDCHTHMLDYPTEQIGAVLENAQKNGIKKIAINTTTSKQFLPLLKLLEKQELQKEDVKKEEEGLNQSLQAMRVQEEEKEKVQVAEKVQKLQKIEQNPLKRKLLLGGFGVHPCFVGEQSKIQEDWFGRLQQILKMKEEYSIGEIGLDYRKDTLQTNPKQLQLDYFKKQMNLALKLRRTATIHCVRSHGELLKYLKQLNKSLPLPKPHLIMHSYGGSEDITKSMLKLQNLNIFFSLSLKRSVSLCSIIPIDRLICETDSPCLNNLMLLREQNMQNLGEYWKSVQKRGIKMGLAQEELERYVEKMDSNQPANIVANVKELSKHYNMDFPKFAQILFKNSLRAFKLIK